MEDFAPIGPFALRRTDQLAAVFLISFVTGSLRVRMQSWLVVLADLAGALYFAATGNGFAAVFLLLVGIFIYVLAPLLRSNKLNQGIMLSPSEEGLVVETHRVRTTYKWATLGGVRYFRSRLFVMLAGHVGLVVPEVATSRANLEALARLIEGHRVAK